MLPLILLRADQFMLAVELTGSPAPLATLLATAAALLLTVAVALRTVHTPARALTCAAVRQRTERKIFVTLCHPAVAGRPRPRAPSGRPRVA